MLKCKMHKDVNGIIFRFIYRTKILRIVKEYINEVKNNKNFAFNWRTPYLDVMNIYKLKNDGIVAKLSKRYWGEDA
jgi:hypothetical protein